MNGCENVWGFYQFGQGNQGKIKEFYLQNLMLTLILRVRVHYIRDFVLIMKVYLFELS